MERKKREEQAKDAGLAMVLILLLFVLLGGKQSLLLPAIICLVLVMSVPSLFAPWARVWFAISHLLGTAVSKIMLTTVFYLVAAPIGILRRLGGADAMRTKIWKKGTDSVFFERNHRMMRKDVERPY